MLSFAGLDEIRFSSGKPQGPDPCVVRLEAAIAMAHEFKREEALILE
jgi:hypothetical protein